MNLKEQCAVDGITLAEGKEKYGLTHWKQEVVIEAPVQVPQNDTNGVTDISYHSKPKPVVTKVKEAPAPVIETVSKEDKIKSVRGLGTKSPYWSELNG